MAITKQTFQDTTEILDGNQYIECTFNNCQIIYRGGAIPSIQGCQFNDCRWNFEEAAERTLQFMRAIYHGMGANGPQMIESAIDAIRKPNPA